MQAYTNNFILLLLTSRSLKTTMVEAASDFVKITTPLESKTKMFDGSQALTGLRTSTTVGVA